MEMPTRSLFALFAACVTIGFLASSGSSVSHADSRSAMLAPTATATRKFTPTPTIARPGTGPATSQKSQVQALANISAVAAGPDHTCALTTSGGVKCWGYNYYGQLGDGTQTNRLAPVDVSGLASGVSAIVPGGGHTCALTTSGAVKCWGRNEFGQLGDGTTANHYAPTDVNGLTSGVSAIAVGENYTCALTTSGGVKCWGYNNVGQLGDGTTTDHHSPADVSGLTSGVSAVAAGYDHTCVLTTSGGVRCWGRNDFGQLGDGTTVIIPPYGKPSPVDVSGLANGVSAIGANYHHTCALTTNGGVKCWGNNQFGELGDGTTVTVPPYGRLTPVDVSDLTTGVGAIAVGGAHTCALTTSGGAKCWGSNYDGQLGDATTTQRLTPVDVSGLASGVSALAAGGDHTCALTTSSGVKCWGYNVNGELGNGKLTYHMTPGNVSGLTSGVSAIAVGSDHNCALMSSSGIQCWGRNDSGQLGDGTTTNKLTPVNVSGLTTGVSAIAGGEAHTCALMSSSGAKCWGNNIAGQLGDGTTVTSPPYGRLTPVDVSGLTTGVSALAGGEAHTCALTTSGGAMCWGMNNYGQLGDGTTTQRLTPVDVSGMTSGVSAIAAGLYHTCALTTSGGVKCWGDNSYGQLGDGTTTGRVTPVDVSGLTSGVSAITVGSQHTCALTTSDGVRCWGRNEYYQLGDASLLPQQLTPVDVSGLTSGVSAVAAGGSHTCALTAGGGIKCWGGNFYGQLGDATTITGVTPVDVSGLTSGVDALAAGWTHTCALTTTGGVQCWGYNLWGQLGNGEAGYYTTPQDVGEDGGTAPIDIGFRPNPNGYQFANYGGTTQSDFTTDDMRRMFGDAAVCVMSGTKCRAKPAAIQWNNDVIRMMSAGHCDGFTTTALRFFKGFDSLVTFQAGANTTHDLLITNARRNIAYYWALQVPNPVAAARDQALQNTPSQVLAQLTSAMSGAANDPTTLIFYNSSGTSGHSVLPYAIEDQSGGIYWIDVYDNNYPNDATRHVVLNTTANTWSYNLGGSVGTWSGGAASHSLGAIPLSTYAQQPQCPWCPGGTSSQVVLNGLGHLLITNSSGQRIGYAGTQFVDEIPSAFGSVPLGGLGVPEEPIYSLPLTDTYALLLDGQTLAQPQTVAVTQYGPGYADTADGVTLKSTSRDTLIFSPDGTQLGYRSSDTKAVTLTLSLDGPTQSNQFQIGSLNIGSGQVVTESVNTGQGILVLNDHQGSSGTYTLNITRVSEAGTQIFTHSGIPISATDTQFLNYGTWDGTGSMTLQIDQGSQGRISQTVTLSNQGSTIFLPFIRR